MKKEDLLAILNNAESSIDEKVASIFALNGKDVNNAKSSNESLQSRITELESQIKESNEKLASFTDYDDLKKFKEDAIAKEENQRKVDWLKSQGCKHPDLFINQIDFNDKYDETKKTYNIDLKEVKEKYKDMFENVEQQHSKQESNANVNSMSGVEQAFYKNNPDLLQK
jgi:hypothetical protein